MQMQNFYQNPKACDLNQKICAFYAERFSRNNYLPAVITAFST